MPYIYLISSVVCCASESLVGAFYNKKNSEMKDSSPLYSFLAMCSVFVFWTVMFCTDSKMDWNVAWYALLFAGFYTLCNVCMIRALKTGPVLLTSLFLQLSLIGTTVWGFFFWNAKFTLLVAMGLALVVLAIWLCLRTGQKESEGTKINVKWLIYVVFMFIGNAGCSITQRTQQTKFDGEYGNFLMMLATGLSVMICLIIYLKSDRCDSKRIVKGSWYFPVMAGGLNGFLNLFVILLATSPLSSSLVYPVIGVGSLMITTLFSTVVFKEKMRWWQWIGIITGMAAVAILSL